MDFEDKKKKKNAPAAQPHVNTTRSVLFLTPSISLDNPFKVNKRELQKRMRGKGEKIRKDQKLQRNER
jgi:hypothetical protein